MSNLGGTFTFPGTGLTVHRMGFGAMQLPGKGVWGPPRDHEQALAVVREAVDSGIDHIDTADFYGPEIANQLIREALFPYPRRPVVVSKIGAKRGPDASWRPATSDDEIVAAIKRNVETLGLAKIDIVNVRLFDPSVPPAEVERMVRAVVSCVDRGLVGHVGMSNASAGQVRAAQGVAPIVCVQNHYNLIRRADDAMIYDLAAQGIPYVPFFPLGGFSPIQSGRLDELARRLDVTPMQLALAWLLARSPNVLLIPGTSSLAHLRENIAAASVEIPEEIARELNALAGKPVS